VREEPGMALGHGRLGGLEVCVDERARVRSASGPGILEFVRGPGQGRGEFLEVRREEVFGNGQCVLEFDDEFLRVERNLGLPLPASDAAFVDEPVLERQNAGGERVAAAAVDDQLPGALPGVLWGGAALPSVLRGG